MFKWILGLAIATTIFSSPVNQNTIIPNEQNLNVITKTVKTTAKNVLVTVDNVLEVVIRNIDSTTVQQKPTGKKMNIKSF